MYMLYKKEKTIPTIIYGTQERNLTKVIPLKYKKKSSFAFYFLFIFSWRWGELRVEQTRPTVLYIINIYSSRQQYFFCVQTWAPPPQFKTPPYSLKRGDYSLGNTKRRFKTRCCEGRKEVFSSFKLK